MKMTGIFKLFVLYSLFLCVSKFAFAEEIKPVILRNDNTDNADNEIITGKIGITSKNGLRQYTITTENKNTYILLLENTRQVTPDVISKGYVGEAIPGSHMKAVEIELNKKVKSIETNADYIRRHKGKRVTLEGFVNREEGTFTVVKIIL